MADQPRIPTVAEQLQRWREVSARMPKEPEERLRAEAEGDDPGEGAAEPEVRREDRAEGEEDDEARPPGPS